MNQTVSFLPNEEAARAIPRQPQTQASLDDQLKTLRIAANRLGLYDAADFLGRKIIISGDAS